MHREATRYASSVNLTCSKQISWEKQTRTGTMKQSEVKFSLFALMFLVSPGENFPLACKVFLHKIET